MASSLRRISLFASRCGLCGKKQTFSTEAKLLSKVTVCVEGNIGSGKTTFLRHFEKYDKLVETNGEPVQQWRDFGGENPLAAMYGDTQRWAFTFQSLVLLTLIQRHTQQQLKPVRVMERSVYSARYCFIENLRQRGMLTDIEHIILNEYFNHSTSGNNVTVDLIVYLKTSPEICYQRIKSRNRPEEQIVSMDYLQQLHDLHEDWLLSTDRTSVVRPPVLVVNGDHDKVTMTNKYSSIQSQILNQLQQCIYR